MAITITKPAVNISERLSNLDGISLENFKAMDATFSGRVGITGELKIVSQPSDGELTIFQGTNTYLRPTNNLYLSTGTATDLFNLVNANVGIGTTSPATILDCRENSTGASTQIRVYNTDNSNTTTQTAALFLAPDSRANGALIYAEKENADFSTNADRDVSLVFSPVLNNSQTEAMRIDSSGNTTFKANNSAVGPVVTLENTATAVNGQAWGSIHFDSNDSSTNASGTRASIVGTSTSFNGDGNLDFYTAPANGTNTFAMRIDSAGNVGINCAAESFAKLEVKTATDRAIAIFDNAAGPTICGLTDAGASAALRVAGNNLLFTGAGGAGNTHMTIDSSGDVSIGTASVFSGARLSLNQSGGNPALACRTSNSSGTVAVVVFVDGDSTDCGSIDVDTTTNTTAYTTSSDQRLKDNIVDAPSASDDIDAIQVRSFDWKSSGYHQTYGLVAQELVDVAPEAVSQGKTEDDIWGVDYSKLVPMLIKEVQQLRARVAQLEGAN